MIRRFLSKTNLENSEKTNNLNNKELNNNLNNNEKKELLDEINDLKEIHIYDIVLDNEYSIIYEMNKNKNSSIYLLKCKISKEFRVLKVYKKQKKEATKYLSEELHLKLNHPNIIRIYDMMETKNYILILMEYLDDDLFEIIQRYYETNEYLSECRISKYIEQIVFGLKYCKDKFGIMHRDIKAENILLDIDDNIKIIDFEYATNEKNSIDICGTIEYMAPELIKPIDYLIGYDYKIDVWSLGILTYELLYNILPFQISKKEIKKKEMLKTLDDYIYIVNFTELKFPEIRKISNKAKDFLQQLLKMNPKERLTYEEILKHPFIIEQCEE